MEKENRQYHLLEKKRWLPGIFLVFAIVFGLSAAGNIRQVHAAEKEQIRFARGVAYDSEGNRLILKGNSAGLGPAYGAYDIIVQTYWVSSNSGIIRIEGRKDGLNCNVKAVSPGFCSITATTVSNYYLNGLLKDVQTEENLPYKFRVVDTISSIKLGKKTLSMNLNSTAQLSYTTVPSDLYSRYMNDFRFRSSNTKVAAVDEDGKITAVGTGTATITASTSQGVTATCKVTVKRPKAAAIKLNQTKVTLGVGETQKLTGSLSPKGASGKITWSSSNPKAAGVSSSGTVKAKALGKTTITAKLASGVRASCTVTVVKRPSSVKLNKKSLTLVRGSSQKLTYTLSPKNTVASVTWSSSNPKVASVDKNGKVKAVKVGTASITVKTVNGKKTVCKVKITPPPAAKIRLSSTSLTVLTGEKTKLAYTLTPSDSANKPKWSSSNPKVAAVDSKGNVTAKAAGTATITAKISSKVFAKCKIKVNKKVPVSSISIRASVPYLGVGETIKLKAAVSPSNTTDQMKWSSENPSVATVAQDGTVRGMKAGGTVIRASAGKITKSYRIAVVSGDIYDISKGNITVGDGKVTQAGRTYSYNAAGGITVVQSTASTNNMISVNNLGNTIMESPKKLTPIKIVLANVCLTSSEAIHTVSDKDVTLELMAGTRNILSAPWFGIMANGANRANLVIQGSGSLEVDAGSTAIRCRKLLIRSGTVVVRTESSKHTVIGDTGAYGFDDMDYSLSVLSGAKVTAYGGSRAIGTDEDAPQYPINISVAQGSLTYYKTYKK